MILVWFESQRVNIALTCVGISENIFIIMCCEFQWTAAKVVFKAEKKQRYFFFFLV